MRALAPILLTLAALAGPAAAQLRRPVPPPPISEAELPPPDPKSWWDDKQARPPEPADPLGGRRLARGERTPVIASGVDASTYRLWGLMPLQWQLLRSGEMILEVWVRPARSVRQSIVRVTVRRDGRAFVQGRAGYACCEAGIGRRIAFDAELPPGAAQGFLGLREHPMWSAPREVRVPGNGEAAEPVCIDGVSYDLTLLVPGQARSLRRACDDVPVGQAADALEPALQAAFGHDPRFDVLYPGGVSFAGPREAYQAFVAGGGVLKAAAGARAQSPGSEAAPQAEAAAAAPR